MQRLLSGNHLHLLNLNLINGFHNVLLYSTASFSSSTPSSINSIANYLVDSLGFSSHQALSASNKLKHKKVNDFKFIVNANSVVGFFKSHGFNDTHLRRIVNSDPRMLYSNVDNTIQPKLMYLQDQGFSGSDLIRVISVNPQLLLLTIEHSISPALEILKKVIASDTLVISAFKNVKARSCGGVIKNMMPNVDFLTNYGVAIEFIRPYVVRQPGTFSVNQEKFKEIVIRVENKLGISPHSPMFLYGLHLLVTNSEAAIETKCRVFKRFGWSQSDVDTFMMKSPCCFGLSDETIEKKLEFFVNELGFKPADLTANNAFFTCSLEKRILPRHKVLLILKEKGLVEKIPSFYKAICMSESSFLKMFVMPFEEVRQVYAKLAGCRTKMLTQ